MKANLLSVLFLVASCWSFGMTPGGSDPAVAPIEKSQQTKAMDGQPPIASCQNVTLQLNASGSATIVGPSYSIPFFTEQFASDPVRANQTTDLVNWKLISGSVDVGNYVPSIPGKTVDMEGDNNGVIETKNNLEFYPGTYQVTFQHRNNNAGSNNSLRVSLGSFVSQDFVAPSNVQTATMTFTVTSNMLLKLRFTQLGPSDKSGNFIGDIKVSRVYDKSFAIDNGSTDNSQLAGLSASQEVFTCADLGSNLVTLTATDVHGNTSSCNATVTILDPFAPQANCQDVTLTLDANGEATIVGPGYLDTKFADQFASDPIASNQTTDLTNWNLLSGSVDVGNYISSISGRSIDLAGDNNGIIRTKEFLKFYPGTYQLTFVHQNNGAGSGNSVEISLAGLISPTVFASPTNAQTETITINVTSATTAKLVLKQLGPNDRSGSFLGDFKLSRVFDQSFAINNGSSDNCELVDISVSKENFTCADLGNNSVVLTVTDANGNVATCTANVTVVDNQAPTIVCAGDQSIGTDPGICGAALTANHTASDNCTATVAYSPSLGTILPLGATQVTATATDASGNTASCSYTVTVTDDEAPTVNPKNITLQLDANGNATITPQDLDNGSVDNCSVANLNVDRNSFDCNDLFQTTTITRVSDANWTQSTVEYVTANPPTSRANQLPDNSTYTLSVQNVYPYASQTPFTPAVPGTSPIYSNGGTKFFKTNFNLTGQPSSLRIRARVDNYMEIFVNGHSIGFENSLTVQNFNNSIYHDIYIDANGVQNGYLGGMQFDVVTTQDILTLLQPGNNELVFAIGNINGNDEGGFTVRLDAEAGGVPVSLTANDPAGNSASETAFVLVEDNLPPVMSCPADMVVAADAGQCSAAVNFNVGHQDNCSSTISYSHAPGSIFPVGTTTVTATAVDLSGNEASCSFNITVEDQEAPVLTCSNNITVTASSSNGAQVSYANATATDNCSSVQATLTQGLASGSTFPIGTTQVTFAATDAAGNTGTCSFNVTVEGIAPVIECPNDLSVSNDANQCGAAVAFQAVDNTGSPASTITYSHAPGSVFPLGSTVVTATATNSVGSSTCTFTVTVTDDEAPVVNCPADMVLNNQTDECGANAQFAATATDNCSVASIHYSHNSGSFFAVGTTMVTVTATDGSGNTAQCTFNVTVNDVQSPEFQALVGNPFPTNTASQPGVFAKQGNLGHAGSPYRQQMVDHADFDGDGDQDLVYALNGNSPSVYLNDGLGVMTGGFQTGGTQLANAVTTADVNADGAPDIIYGFWGSGSIGNSKVYLNDGTGGFTLAQDNIGGIDRVNDVKAGDLNGDGHLDLYFVGSGYNTRTDRVWFGNGTGQFTPSAQVFNTTAWGTQMAMADYDGDGDLDVFTAANFPNNSSSLWLNDGSGTFSQAIAGMVNGTHPRAEDYDGDGDLDIVYAGGSNTGNINIFLNDGNANFTASNDVYTSSPGNYAPSSVEFGDIDNDGDRDMVIAYNGTNTANSPRIYLNDGNNNYSAAGNIPLQYVYAMRNMLLIDMDNDGDLDFTNANYAWFNEVLFNQLTHPSAGGCEDVAQTADNGQCGAIVQFDYAASDNCPGVSTVYSQNPGTFFPVGTTTVTATATDAAGNVGSCQFDVMVTDDEAPVVQCPGDITASAAPGSCSANVQFAVQHSDNCSSTISYSHAPGSVFQLGTTVVTATATDPAGNTSVCSFNVIVEDNEAPTIVCPSDITEFATSANGATVNYNVPVGNDNCSVASVVLTQGLSSGSTFPIGTTQVTYTVTDGSGNSASCSFDVTIEGIAPEIECPNDMVVNTDAGQCGAAVTFAATDNVGIPASTITYSHAPGSVFGVGTTLVTATATNAVGTSTCTFTVTVEDNEAPVVVCPADITVDNDAGVCGAEVSFAANSTDNCSSTITYSHPSGSVFPIGTTTVTATATDPSGNSSSCMFDVTVEDNEAPVVVCPADITVDNDAGVCGAIVTFEANSTDNCSSTVSYSHASGSDFPVGTTAVTVTAIDPSGNSASCTFDVTVEDNEAPNVVTNDISVTLSNGTASIVAADIDGGSTDNCGIAQISVDESNWDCSMIGDHQVVLTVADIHGNVASATAVVTVVGAVPSCNITSNPTSNVYTGGDDNALYLGYGAGSTVLQTSTMGGSLFTYSWTGTGLNCYNCANPEFTPTEAGQYNFEVTVTNEFGCSSTCQITICVYDVRVYNKKGKEQKNKVLVCHVPPGNPGNAHTISVGANAVQAHLDHGCSLGDCNQTSCGDMPAKSNLSADDSHGHEGEFGDHHLVVEPELSAFPNPSSGAFNIQLTTENESEITWKLMDATGKVVVAGSAEANQVFQVDTILSMGVYMLEVNQGDFHKTVRLIKN